jgi:hypothetical protein
MWLWCGAEPIHIHIYNRNFPQVQEIFVMRCGFYVLSGNFELLADRMAAAGALVIL